MALSHAIQYSVVDTTMYGKALGKSCRWCTVTQGYWNRWYFTNTDSMKRDDPYAQLGLHYGDGATTTEIQQAYRKRAARLHPDVNKVDPPALALRKFQDLQRAYEALMKVHSSVLGISEERDEEWRFSIWVNGDRIARERTDVAGLLRKRPVPPAASETAQVRRWGSLLGHPTGRGVGTVTTRGEYLSSGVENDPPQPSSSVGRGVSKWVKPKEFIPWDGTTKATKR